MLTWLLFPKLTSSRDLHPNSFSVAAWNPFPHKPLQLVPPLQLLIAAPLTKQGVPSLSSASEYSKVGREELLLPRKVKVGPSKETILVLGGELATHLVGIGIGIDCGSNGALQQTHVCKQRRICLTKKKKSLDETLKRTVADSRESSCWPQS